MSHNIIESNTYQESPSDEFTEMLEGKTKQELVKYARMTYNLSVNMRYSKPDLIEAIKSAAAKFKMNSSLQSAQSIADNGLSPGYAEIQLHRTELTKGLRSVIVSLNGTAASLPIGHKFGCPLELVEILDNAVRIEYEKNPDTDELEQRRTHAYPFTVFSTNPHTRESQARSARMRGFKGRPPREFWDEEYAARIKQQQDMEAAFASYEDSEA